MPVFPGETKIWAIVVAAGEGRRFGGAKQFFDLEGASVLERSLTAVREVADHVVAVVPATALDGPSFPGGADVVVPGGRDRAGSVRAGLAAVAHDAEVIVVHDAARPLASAALFHEVVAAVIGGADGAIPGLPVADTVKRVADHLVVETLDREGLVTVQTPQAFRAAALREAHAQGGSATDDAALLERVGGRVVVVRGELRNIKLTDPSDLDVAIRYLRELSEGARS